MVLMHTAGAWCEAMLANRLQWQWVSWKDPMRVQVSYGDCWSLRWGGMASDKGWTWLQGSWDGSTGQTVADRV